MTRRPVNPIRRAEDLDDERTEAAFVRFVVAVSAGLWLALAGAVIWGVIALVQHITN